MSNRNITFRTRLRMVKCYILSTLLYGSELLWTVTKNMKHRIEAVEMWMLRRMLKIGYTEHKTNAEVLRMAGTERQLFRKIQSTQLQYFGHVARHDTLQRVILTGKMNGKRGRGRPRRRWTDNIKRWSGTEEVFREAQKRAGWRAVAANPRREDDT